MVLSRRLVLFSSGSKIKLTVLIEVLRPFSWQEYIKNKHVLLTPVQEVLGHYQILVPKYQKEKCIVVRLFLWSIFPLVIIFQRSYYVILHCHYPSVYLHN